MAAWAENKSTADKLDNRRLLSDATLLVPRVSEVFPQVAFPCDGSLSDNTVVEEEVSWYTQFILLCFETKCQDEQRQMTERKGEAFGEEAWNSTLEQGQLTTDGMPTGFSFIHLILSLGTQAADVTGKVQQDLKTSGWESL
ncbi:unnamed protein product [Caenorhabditis auriculariae]|uniref:Uncharacterized protein n=1 Tax=Caenorhabditis auriculariae TaxID=2777116 RepID=A0A8S1GNE9_9PELO|nr:unnamed protein product [Caenorhabditis auriculariae]